MLDRSLNMMRSAKCTYCMPLETTCFMFGVVSAVVSGVAVLALSLPRSLITYVTGDDTYELLSRNPDTAEEVFEESTMHQQMVILMATLVAVVFLYVWFLTAFIFSVFLCYGTYKKRPGFVKAYLIYGVTATVLMMVGAILYSWVMVDIVGGSLVLIACGIYSMMLLMVQRTHELIRAAQARDRALLLPGPGPCVKA